MAAERAAARRPAPRARPEGAAASGVARRAFTWAPTGAVYLIGDRFEGTPGQIASLKARGYLEEGGGDG